MTAIIQEAEALGMTTVPGGWGQFDFSAEYSRGELEEMGSRELLEGYAE
jgi:hypothetical protein